MVTMLSYLQCELTHYMEYYSIMNTIDIISVYEIFNDINRYERILNNFLNQLNTSRVQLNLYKRIPNMEIDQ